MTAAGDFTALVALRAKQGEFTALCKWDRADQTRLVQPLLVLDPDGSPKNQIDTIEKIARRLYRNNRPLMIDPSDVAHSQKFGGGPAGALGELTNRLDLPADLFDEHYPVPFIPVLRSGSSTSEISLWQNICEELGLGGAIRLRPGYNTRRDVEDLLESIRLPAGDIDIIIDLQYVPKITEQTIGQAFSISRTAEVEYFRSVTLLSGSVPQQLQKTETWIQDRFEEILWQRLNDNTRTNIRLGDYGVTHPNATRGHRSKHVNLKYSCTGLWRYYREPANEPPDGEESSRAFTLRMICRGLAHSDHFSGEAFSWGDKRISAFDEQTTKWGHKSWPIALATSHHLAYLAARSHPNASFLPAKGQ